jgi:hypothetical protein
MSVNLSSVLAAVVKDAKTAVTFIGYAIAAITAVTGLGFVPSSDKVLAAVVVLWLTTLARDITDVVTDLPSVPPAAPPSV